MGALLVERRLTLHPVFGNTRLAMRQVFFLTMFSVLILGAGCRGVFGTTPNQPPNNPLPEPPEQIQTRPVSTTTPSSTATTITNIPDDWKVYENKELGLRFRYPRGWVLQEEKTKNFGFRIILQTEAPVRHDSGIDNRRSITFQLNGPMNIIDAGFSILYFPSDSNFNFLRDKEDVETDLRYNNSLGVYRIIDLKNDRVLFYQNTWAKWWSKSITLSVVMQNTEKELSNLFVHTNLGDYYKVDTIDDISVPVEERRVVLDVDPEQIIKQSQQQQFYKDFITIYNSIEF